MNSCVDCAALTSSSKCGTGTCINYFYSNVAGAGPDTITCTACNTIANTIPRLPSTPGSACSCAEGYVWNPLSKLCVACNLLAGYTFNPSTGTCTSCNFKNAVQNINFRDGDKSKPQTCRCDKNYVLSGASCGCDNSKSFDLGNGKGCGPCTSILGASSASSDGKKGVVSAPCKCVTGSTWDSTNFRCVCTLTAQIMTNKGCKACYDIPETAGPDPSSPYQCRCVAGYNWDPLNNICVCSDPASVLTTGGTCLSCLSVAGSNGTRISSTACGCLGANKWNPISNKCDCDPTVGIMVDGICKACSTIKGASKSAKNGQCVCNSGRKWQSNSCVCTSGSKCPCGAGNFQLSSGECVPCQGIAGANGLSTSTGQCICYPGFEWKNISATCACRATYVTDTVSICVPCNIINNATLALTSNTCYCLPNHFWNPLTFNCDFTNAIASTQNLIKTFDGSILSCVGLGGSTGRSVDNFNC